MTHPKSKLTSPLEARVYIGFRAYDVDRKKMVHVKDVSIVMEHFTAEEVVQVLERIAPEAPAPRRINVGVRRFKKGRQKLETVKTFVFEGRTAQELHDAIVSEFQKEG